MRDWRRVRNRRQHRVRGEGMSQAAEVQTPAAATIPTVPVAAAAKPPAISTVQLTKRYGTLTALDALTLELESGDIFGFIGPNGAGKSTTMKILAGLLEPTSGFARVLGKNVAEN